MFNLFQNIHIDWLGKRKIFIAFSIFIMLMGLISTIGRQYTPGGADAFNLGVDFKGGPASSNVIPYPGVDLARPTAR